MNKYFKVFRVTARGNGLGQDAWGNLDAVNLEFRCLNILNMNQEWNSRVL